MPEISSLTILDGAIVPYTLVSLRVVAADATEIAFSNDGTTWSDWQSYSGLVYAWTLTPGDGAKIVRVKVRNEEAEEDSDQVAVTLDTEDVTDALLDNLPAVYSRAHSGLLWEIFGAAATELALLKKTLKVGQDQLDMQRAREYWLNLWGRLVGVSRRRGETDAAYAPRIIARLTGPKLTPLAVRLALEDELGGTAVSVTDLTGHDGFLLVQIHGAVEDMDAVWRRLREVKAAGLKAVVVTQ